MPAITHVKSIAAVADWANTVTVFNSQGSTTTVAATDLARPGDWNSAHAQLVSISGDTLGTSAATATNVVFGGTNNIQLSLSTVGSGATIWIQNDFESYYANLPQVVASTAITNFQSTSGVYPFVVPYLVSADFIRIYQSGNTSVASTTLGTTANTTFSNMSYASHNFVLYQRGTGANSTVMQYVTSTQFPQSYSVQFGAGNTGSQYSVSMRYTLPCSTGNLGLTKDFSSTQTNIALHSSHITDITGFKQVDFPFPVTLSDGQYFLAYGVSTTTSSNGVSGFHRDNIVSSSIGVSQGNNSFGTYGSATNSSVAWQPGLGSFTTNGAAGTTASIPFSAVSSSASNNMLYFQFMRIA